MNWLRKLLAGETQNGAMFARPCCGEYERCQRACVPRGRSIADTEHQRTLDALQRLYEETADYITLNHLGKVHHNRSMQMARDALATNGRTIWAEVPVTNSTEGK